MRSSHSLIALLALSAVGMGSIEAYAAENAAGWYALGTKGSMAGFLPPPGTYFVDVNMYYEGCGYRKPRPGRSGYEVRQGWRVT